MKASAHAQFTCNSYIDKRCIGDEAHKLVDEMNTKCEGTPPNGSEYKLCRKIKQVIDFEVNGLKPESRIIRTCGWDNSNYMNKCYQRSGFGGRQEVCACEGDGCNSGTSFYASVSLLIGLLALQQINL
ncbi:hypothetical protein BDFB_001681 [Asbolus verrucosus]|uniref:Uncharacterized protein n=1 Tax=Asbolus verrucosus TaxID=1661398 RepID=A0A482WBH8_ASBVE|nr:hypothetical protein BDFB_001681 [Asbolus verrucosus]